MTGRRRRRSGAGAATTIALLLVVTVLVGPGPVGLEAFQTGDVDRAPSLDTVDDGSGGLSIASYHGMQSGETCTLADFTNGMGSTLSVTVSLRDDSAQYGNLTLGSGDAGNEVTFTLSADETERVEIVLDSNLDDGTNVYFDAIASGGPVTVSATDRSATVDSSQSGTECSA